MVIDELEAKEKAEYSFRCIWQTLGQIDLSEQTLKVDQKGKTFYIKSADGARFKLSEDTDQGGNWSAYEFAKPVVWVLQQVANKDMQPGEKYVYLNLLQTSNKLKLRVSKVSDSSSQIEGDGQAFVGVREPNRKTEIKKNLSLTASKFHLTPKSFALVAATSLLCLPELFQSDRPVV